MWDTDHLIECGIQSNHDGFISHGLMLLYEGITVQRPLL